MELRTAGIAVIKSGVPVVAIVPARLKQRSIERIGGDESEAVNLAISSIASFTDVVLRAIGGDVRMLETDISRIYVIPVDVETKVILFVPGKLEVDERLLKAIEETVRNVSDPNELEQRLKSLLEALNKPESEFLPEDYPVEDVELLAKVLTEVDLPEVYHVYKIAVAVLAPAGIPNATIFEERDVPCIEKAPESDPANADEIIEKILRIDLKKTKAHVLSSIPGGVRKFGGGEVIRLEAPEYTRVLSCVEHLKDRRRFLESFLSDFPARVARYVNERLEEIEEELSRKRRFLETLEKRLEKEKEKASKSIFEIVFSDEIERARDVLSQIEYRLSALERLISEAPRELPETLEGFKRFLGELFTRAESMDSFLSSMKADLGRVKDEISTIEEGVKSKEASFRETLESELKDLLTRIESTKQAIAELEEEIVRLQRIQQALSEKLNKAIKRARSLLKRIDQALSSLVTIPYTSAAFVLFAFEHRKGVSVWMPKFYKRRKSELERIARSAILSGMEPLDEELVRNAVMRAISIKGSKRFEKKLRKSFSAFLRSLRTLPVSPHAGPYFLRPHAFVA